MGLGGAAVRAAAAGLILIAGIARGNGIVTCVNFGQGNLDGWAAFANANAAAALTTIPPYLVALSRVDDDPVAATLSRAGQAPPLAVQFAGKAFENPLFAMAPFVTGIALPPPAVTTSRPVAPDYSAGEPAAPAAFRTAVNVAPPIPLPLLSFHPGEASADAWAENERRNHPNWSSYNPWFYYDYGSDPVPEPGTLALLSAGLVLLALGRRFRSIEPR
jgi:hypothetical protein